MTIDPAAFLSLEDDLDVFDVRVDRVPVWERIRFDVFREIQERDGIGRAHTPVNHDFPTYLRGFYGLVRNLFRRNPFLADPADVMFVGHHRRKRMEDGLWWDIYCDPIHEGCGLDSVHFEKPYLMDHEQPAKTDELRYLDLIDHGGFLLKTLGLYSVSIGEEPYGQLRRIQQAISERFGVTIDLVEHATKAVRDRRSTYWLYRRLLSRIAPKTVVVVVSYGRETIVEACKSAGVPVVELQHGVIHEGHLGYHFPGSRTKETFPDYLLTWGEYWNTCVEYPLEDDHVIPVGFPFHEVELEKYSGIDGKDQILFISQGTVGVELSRFALAVDDLCPAYEVVYKLHPGEYDRWQSEYPWLAESGMSIVDDDSIPLYRLFAESSVMVGVSSTAIVEGLGFDLRTYLIEMAGIEPMRELVSRGYVETVSTPEELVAALRSGEPGSTVDHDKLFRPEAIRNIDRALEEIVG